MVRLIRRNEGADIACGRILCPVVLMHLAYDAMALAAISSNLDRVLQAWSLPLFSW